MPFDVAAFQRRWAEHRFMNSIRSTRSQRDWVRRIAGMASEVPLSEKCSSKHDLASCGGQGIIAGNVFRYPLLCLNRRKPVGAAGLRRVD